VKCSASGASVDPALDRPTCERLTDTKTTQIEVLEAIHSSPFRRLCPNPRTLLTPPTPPPLIFSGAPHHSRSSPQSRSPPHSMKRENAGWSYQPAFSRFMRRRGLEPPRDFTPTSTSSWRVCQFRHLRGGKGRTAEYSGANDGGKDPRSLPGRARRCVPNPDARTREPTHENGPRTTCGARGSSLKSVRADHGRPNPRHFPTPTPLAHRGWQNRNLAAISSMR